LPRSASSGARRSGRFDVDDEIASRLLGPVDVETSSEDSDELVVDTFGSTLGSRIEIEREADPAIDPLLARIAALEEEVDRLQATVRDGDSNRKHYQERLAVNKLLHEKLWRDLYELLADPEVFADDPARAFPLLLRVVDETGVATVAADEYGTRRVTPEPEAEETSVKFRRDVHPYGNDNLPATQIELACDIVLPRVPETWRGYNNAVHVDLRLERCEGGVLEFSLTANDGSHPDRLEVNVDWRPDFNYVARRPWHGGDESRQMEPNELPELHAAIDQLFDRLEMRLR
jgi:hypothetical protein